jgi:hypothetical protein
MPEKKTVEEWAKTKGTADWLFAAAKAAFKWAQGKELDEAQYDELVEKAANAGAGDGNPHNVKTETKKSDAETQTHVSTLEPQKLGE